MLKKIFKTVGIIAVLLVVTGGLMYLLGFRIILDGGGGVHLGRVKSADTRAEEIARHREAQRAAIPASQPGSPSAPAASTDPQAQAPNATPGPQSPAPSPVSVYWTNFRGPSRDGHYRERPITTSWPAGGPKPIWKQPIGAGYASFVIANGRAFTIEQRGAEEVATAYDIATGRELWANRWTATFHELMGGDGPRATPTWHNGKVFALGGTGELRCIDDASGRTVWRTNILMDAGATNLQWGMSASPLVVGNTVIVLPGGGSGQSVVAYDIASGKRLWSALDDKASYSSPMLVTRAGVQQIVLFTATRLVGLTPGKGELLWEFPWKTQYEVNASQPVMVGDNRVFISTGYGSGAAMIELTQADGRLAVREVWRTNRMKNQFASSVLHDGYLYGLDESILACLDAATGDLKWKGGRYGYGQIMLASDHLVVLTETGEIALVRATPTKHEELVKFPVLEGKSWNHPAMSDGYLLVRNINEMAAFDLRK